MVNALLRSEGKKWLEPSFGRGVFLDALHARQVQSNRIFAVDLDQTPSESDRFAHVLRGIDFLNWAAQTKHRFDCIVGNPPFIAIRALSTDLCRAAASVLDHDGKPIGKRANTWYAFLQASIRLLAPGGSLAFLLPAAAEYADYCRSAREAATSVFQRVDLVRSRSPLFSDVEEGAIVLVCRGKGHRPGEFRRHEVADLDQTIARLSSLDQRKARRCPNRPTNYGAGLTRLGDVMRIRLGGVTGDARFFVLTDSERKQRGLPRRCVRPILCRAQDLYRPAITPAYIQSLIRDNAPVWLFSPCEADLSHPAVRNYLELSEDNGGCRRRAYKVRCREPWYRTPLPPTPHAFLSGMSQFGVSMCFNEAGELNATNTLYVVQFRQEHTRSEQYAWALSLLTSGVFKQLRRATRIYAGGLKKIEPGQLTGILLPTPPQLRNAISLYRRAISLLVDGDASASRELADDAIVR